jgi:hypothetical protein
MAKIFYRYNPETCKYEPIFHSRKHILGKTGRFLLATFLLATTGVIYLNVNHLSYNEITLKKDNEWLKWEWGQMQKKIEKTSGELAALENDDDNHYRLVLDMEKLDKDIRLGGAGGSQKYQLNEDEKVTEVVAAYEDLSKISSRLEVENQSLVDIDNRVTRFDQMMESRPAMMPIDNRQITRFNTIFGMRMHPILNTWKHHNGLDLTADYGTPVYATGDGIVLEAKPMGGYGNVIFVSHGFGFETRYAHLSKFKVIQGQRVKRGDLIGYVGSTGLSTNPHLHYEVLYHDKWINPIYFMYRDLSQAEYNELIKQTKITLDREH